MRLAGRGKHRRKPRVSCQFRRRMAMRLDHYQQIAAKAAEAGGSGPAGSVLLAVDDNKAEITARVIEEGAVSRLGCDPSLVDALCDKFAVLRAPPPGGGGD